jgi:antibiotic biosynthesis monooxygenase (ABM) superfamily enzyme
MTAAFDKAGVTLGNAATSTHKPFAGSPQEIADTNKGTMCRWDTGDGYLVVWWTTVDSEVWNAAEEAIIARGAAVTDIPGLTADVAYFQSDPGNPSSFARWNVDVLTGSTWIHIGNTLWTQPEDGAKVYKAALAIAKLKG